MAINDFSQEQTVENNLNNLSKNSRDPFYISITSLYPAISQAPMNVTPPLPPASEKYKPTGPIQLSEEKKSASEDKSTVFSTTSEIGEGTITDYMIWSQINILFGAIILGIFAILLSIYTKQLAERDYLRKAKIMSRITLGVNIFITIVFIGAVVFSLAYFSVIK